MPVRLTDKLPREGGALQQVSILIASPEETDHIVIDNLCRRRGWKVAHTRTCEDAIRYAEQKPASVIVADKDVPGGGWERILESLGHQPGCPVLIVSSRVADTTLWGEVLNLGGYDVLSTPFEHDELERVAASAHETWIRASALSAWRRRAEGPEQLALVS